MFSPGHYGMVLLLYSVVGYALLSKRYESHAVVGAVLVVAVTMVPDWDTRVSWLPHRGLTHTVWFALVVGTILGGLVVLDSRRRGHDGRTVAGLGIWAGGLGTLSVFAHLAADAINPAGIRPFAPFSNRHVTLELVPSSDPFVNYGLLAAGLVAAAACWRAATGRAIHEVPAPAVLLSRIYRYVRGPEPK